MLNKNYSEKPLKKSKNQVLKITSLIMVLLLLAFNLSGCAGVFFGDSPLFGGDAYDPSLDGDEEPGKDKFPAEGSIIINKNDGSSPLHPSGSIGNINLSTEDVVALVKDSVVEIRTEVVSNFLNIEDVVEYAGSGVIFSNDGYIATNHHVIEDATYVTVTLANGSEYDAEIIASDEFADIAVLKINPIEKLTAATLGNSDSIVLGEEVLIIGNPLGVLGGSVTSGVISAFPRELPDDAFGVPLIQTDAAVNPGNSGGALFNMRGELIGIVNAKMVSVEVEGIGFAIPINTAYDVFCDLAYKGYVTGRMDLGFDCVEKAAILAGFERFVYVSNLRSKNTALRNGDRIVSLNGVDIKVIEDVEYALEDCEIGDEIDVVALRFGIRINTTITLVEYVP